MFVVREKLADQGSTPATIEIILSSWRQDTKMQYNLHLKKWLAYCNERALNIFSTSVSEALEFLSVLYHKGLSCSAINTARSALSSVLLTGTDTSFSQLPIVKRFMNDIFKLIPSFPKHKDIWDLHIVYFYFRKQKPASQLSLKELSLKVAFLLSLLSGQRCQTIKYLHNDHMTRSENIYIFYIAEQVKQSRVGQHIKPLESYGIHLMTKFALSLI